MSKERSGPDEEHSHLFRLDPSVGAFRCKLCGELEDDASMIDTDLEDQ